MSYLAVFVLSGLVVAVAGSFLTRYADAIASGTKLGGLWVGMVLLAGATSLPELATDIAAVRMGARDIAVGDLFGSSLANMLILAVIDLLPPRRRVLQKVALDQVLGASLAIVLNALATVWVVVGWSYSWLGVGPGSLLLFLGYLAGTRAVYLQNVGDAAARTPAAAAVSREGERPMPVRRALLGFVAAALVLLAAAPLLAWSARGVAEISGLGNTFVGTWLVGLATSLPELVTALAAVRMGAFDLAVGNLFGSNACNMAIFLPLDLVQGGNLFAGLDPGHALSGLFAVLLMSLGIAAIVYRARRRFAMVEPDSLLILVAYAAALWLMARHAAGP
jgi:cation:H+ antiporter